MKKGAANLVSIQWLRALAATLVVLHHIEVQLRRLFEGNVPSFSFGASGVDLFFVVSGFVMVVATHGRGLTTAEFLRRRVVRIVPMYWLLTSIALLLAVLMPQAFYSTTLVSEHVAASYLMLPYPHPVLTSNFPLLVPGWTLNYEMFFYLLFGALLSYALYIRLVLIACAFALLGLATWLCGLLELKGLFANAIGFYGSPIVFEFVAGMLIAKWYLQGAVLPKIAAVVAALLAAGIFGLGVWQGVTDQSSRIFYWGPAAACLVALWAFKERDEGWFNCRFFALIGDASYSLYLTHLFVLGSCTAMIRKLKLQNTLGEPGVILMMLLASFCAAVVVYEFIEQPLLKLFSGYRPRGQDPTASRAILVEVTNGHQSEPGKARVG